MRDPVMRAMEGGGECRAGHVRHPLHALLLWVLSRYDENLIDLEKRDETGIFLMAA